MGPAIVACEERRPRAGGNPVLCVVVERDRETLLSRIEEARAELAGKVGGPADAGAEAGGEAAPLPSIEVLDRATFEAIERLIAAGLLAPTAAFVRPLSLAAEPAQPPPLSAEDQARLQARLEKGRRGLRRARVLGDAGFGEECRESLLVAALDAAAAQAIQRRFPEPAALEETLAAPYAQGWGDGLNALRALLADSGARWQSVAEAVERLLGATVAG